MSEHKGVSEHQGMTERDRGTASTGKHLQFLRSYRDAGNEQFPQETGIAPCVTKVPCCRTRASAPARVVGIPGGHGGHRATLPMPGTIAYACTARTSGNTPSAPARRSRRAATASVQPVSA